MATTARKRSGSDADWLDDWAVDGDGEQRRPLPLGLFALVLGGLFIVLEIVGVFLALDAQYQSATLIGHIVTLGTAVPLLLGLAALITGWGRGWGFLAVVLSLLANPLVLNAVLDWGASLS